VAAACSNPSGAGGVQPEGPRAPPSAIATSAPPVATGATPVPTEAPVASPPASDAGADAAATPAEAATPVDPKNEVKPLPDGEELQARAKALFDAIVRDEPALGESFWFPKEPFIPLKDVKGPDRYWDTLHSAYANDIHALHRKRKTWDGATFTRFERGSPPKWVKPGEEANKIGYYRSFRGTLRFEADGKPAEIEVRTMITWQGRWYITHLSKFK